MANPNRRTLTLPGKAPAAPPAESRPNEACAACRFFVGRASCVRYPSVVLKRPDDWCGEFKRKED